VSRSVAFLHPVATNLILSASTPEGPLKVLESDAVASGSGRMRFQFFRFPGSAQRLFSGLTPTVVPTFTLMPPGFSKAAGYGEFNGTSIRPGRS
jgi:hypothetical protein